MEPISRLPTKKLTRPSPLIYYSSIVVFVVAFVWIAISLVAVQILGTVLLLPQYVGSNKNLSIACRKQFKSVVRLTEKAFGAALVIVCWLLIPETKLVISGDYESMHKAQKAILISNHQIYPDCI